MPGQLFTHYFLTDGIRTTSEWRASVAGPQEFAAFRKGVSGLFDSFAGYNEPNEAVTEQVLIRPVLELLGWTEYLAQQAAAGNEDIPDHLLFADESAKMSAAILLCVTPTVIVPLAGAGAAKVVVQANSVPFGVNVPSPSLPWARPTSNNLFSEAFCPLNDLLLPPSRIPFKDFSSGPIDSFVTKTIAGIVPVGSSLRRVVRLTERHEITEQVE